MAKKSKPPAGKRIEALRHEEAKRRNIPTAEYQSVIQKEAEQPLRVAYERRNRDLDPQLVWRGKDQQDWSDLVVQAPPIYIQEKVLPKVLIDDLLRQTRERRQEAGEVPGRSTPTGGGRGWFIDGGFLRYRYRGTDPNHRDNVGLRLAMQRQAPLIYLHGIVPGLYEPAWPVFIVEDHPDTLTFIVAIDDQLGVSAPWQFNDPAALTARRQYVTAVVRQRLHQRSFRERVLRAYQQCCPICRLRHGELLEAAHILPDGHPLGEPVVPNGLALCKLHHAAFDSYIIGVTPDLEVKVRLDVLEEIDGPMLQHGFQGFQGRRIHVPHAHHLKPNRDFLAERYALFRTAS